jgi:hypothetical protein
LRRHEESEDGLFHIPGLGPKHVPAYEDMNYDISCLNSKQREVHQSRGEDVYGGDKLNNEVDVAAVQSHGKTKDSPRDPPQKFGMRLDVVKPLIIALLTYGGDIRKVKEVMLMTKKYGIFEDVMRVLTPSQQARVMQLSDGNRKDHVDVESDWKTLINSVL